LALAQLLLQVRPLDPNDITGPGGFGDESS
jgi:hypothetical protein